MTALAYLTRLCRRWGGSFETVTCEVFCNLCRGTGWSLHPFGNHASNVSTRSIIAVRDQELPGTLIHEMGHVFLSEGHPARTYEPNWLGWEIALARQARCYRAWSDQNTGYAFTWRRKDREWGELDHSEERQVTADFVERAIKRRIVTPSGVPLCTRRL
jgi:hypothetical protein